MLKINNSKLEGRYKVWLIKISPRTIYFIESDLVEVIAVALFEKYKIFRQEELSLSKTYSIVGETKIRSRALTINRKLTTIIERLEKANDIEIFQNCNITLQKADLAFERMDMGPIFGSSEKSSEYKATDVLILDFYQNRHAWQIKLLNMIYDEAKEEFIEPDDRTIIWIFDPAGCTGKSKFVKWVC